MKLVLAAILSAFIFSSLPMAMADEGATQVETREPASQKKSKKAKAPKTGKKAKKAKHTRSKKSAAKKAGHKKTKKVGGHKSHAPQAAPNAKELAPAPGQVPQTVGDDLPAPSATNE